MKTLKLSSLVILMVLGLSSCSSEEESVLLQEQTAKSLLNGYEISRNMDGSYYVDFNTKGATSDNVKDEKGNINNINLYADNTEISRNVSEDLGFITDGNELKINFNDTQADKVTSISVKDHKINFARDENDLLDEFNFQAKQDGTYDLDFSVKENVVVSFVYNEELDSYDIHLSEGSSSESNFLRTFTPDADGNLKITFVTSEQTSKLAERRPEIVVGG